MYKELTDLIEQIKKTIKHKTLSIYHNDHANADFCLTIQDYQTYKELLRRLKELKNE